MSKEQLARKLRKELRRQPRYRVVPSRRGLAATFAVFALWGLILGGAVSIWHFHPWAAR